MNNQENINKPQNLSGKNIDKDVVGKNAGSKQDLQGRDVKRDDRQQSGRTDRTDRR